MRLCNSQPKVLGNHEIAEQLQANVDHHREIAWYANLRAEAPKLRAETMRLWKQAQQLQEKTATTLRFTYSRYMKLRSEVSPKSSS